MHSNLSIYKPIVEEALNYYRLPVSDKFRGLALHRVVYNESSKTFNYHCIQTDDFFVSLLALEHIAVENIKYAELFPENKEARFDWSAILGHIATFQSTTKFYCFSEQTSKWYKFVAVSPEIGFTLLIAEDITLEKEQEIAKNIARYGNLSKES